jgi:hypothetical protein
MRGPAEAPGTRLLTTPKDDHPAVGRQLAANSKSSKDDRLFWTLPNLLTVESSTQPPPLSTGQKFRLVADGTFDPIQCAFIGIVTNANQLSNTNPTFGKGMGGYSKRYALAVGDNINGNFMTGAVYPSLFHQDPRYYYMGSGRFVRRAWYAGTRIFVTRSDSGKAEFNFSEILGNGTAALIANAYHPGPRTVRSNVNVWWTQIGWDTFSNEMKEFWPDIHRFLHGRKYRPI